MALDRLLDQGRIGPLHLRRQEIAALVAHQLRKVQTDGQCDVHAWVIMPNHVHVLMTPRESLEILMRHLKGPVARAANLVLNLTGEPFWQAEYFDRTIRNQEEFRKIQKYIEANPVRAGLAANPEEFMWSSAEGRGLPGAGLEPCKQRG